MDDFFAIEMLAFEIEALIYLALVVIRAVAGKEFDAGMASHHGFSQHPAPHGAGRSWRRWQRPGAWSADERRSIRPEFRVRDTAALQEGAVQQGAARGEGDAFINWLPLSIRTLDVFLCRRIHVLRRRAEPAAWPAHP